MTEKLTSQNMRVCLPCVLLEEVFNEKQGGLGRCHTFAIGLGPWRSRFVCRLILL
jgi:hypothetical protein